ncbi:BamA/TamA family outer membrane protein [uncultured Draconibacterium sp.]|uniref:BamA/TamA family outer membrane protein n=1 Tax=uncultured Draconibacterium sp. TaxID=1573823 RepID=UPI003216DBA3
MIRTKKTFILLLAILLSPVILFAQVGKAEKDSSKTVLFAAVPVVNYNNSLGLMMGGMTSGYYKLNKKDTISPSSFTMLAGLYTTNKSYMGAIIQNLYFNEDRWRFKGIAGTGSFYFQYLQGLPGGSSGKLQNNGIWIDFDTDARFVLAEIQRLVFPHFYVGLEAMLMHAETTFELPVGDLKPKIISDLNSLGYTLAFDNRNNVNFPVNGFFINFKNRFVRDWIGASDNYDNYEIAANYFWDIKKNSKTVLVSRLYANIASGDVPFQGQNTIGSDDLRGYSKGEFRGNQVYAIQSELRQNVYKKIGVVGFVGVGSAVDEFSEIKDNGLLPSIGFGVRYLMIAKEKINIGMDVGVGKNDWSLTFRIGEAFSR